MDKYAPGSTSNRRRIWGISTPYVSPQNQVWQGCLKAENRTEARGRRDERDRKSMGLQEWKRQMGGIKAQCWGAGAGGALHMERIGGVCQIWKGRMWTVNRNYKIRIKNREEKEMSEFIAQCMKESGGLSSMRGSVRISYQWRSHRSRGDIWQSTSRSAAFQWALAEFFHWLRLHFATIRHLLVCYFLPPCLL